MSPISRKPIAPAKQNAQQDKAEAQAQAKQDQATAKAQAQAQAQAKQDMLAMQKEQAARPRTGVSGPYMPTVGGPPRLSPADKATRDAELANKAAADTPKPGMGTSAPVVPKPTSPRYGGGGAGVPEMAPGMGRNPTSPRYGGGGAGVPETYEGPGTGMGRNPTATEMAPGMKRGGAVRSKPQTKFASGGSVGGASRRGDGIAQRGKTKGRMC